MKENEELGITRARLIKDSRHSRLAQRVLDHVALELERRGLPVVRDNWPYHTITADLDLHVSLSCSGFDRRIDIQPLRKKGEPDCRYKERAFMTPKSAVNCVVKFFERKSK